MFGAEPRREARARSRGKSDMIGYLILIALQIAVAVFGAPFILKFIPVGGDPKVFVQAAVFAVLVWVTGVVMSFALRDVRMPSTSTLASALVVALIAAGLLFIPALWAAIPIKFDKSFVPLAGAIIGYMLRR
jgi:hypothetical protein